MIWVRSASRQGRCLGRAVSARAARARPAAVVSRCLAACGISKQPERQLIAPGERPLRSTLHRHKPRSVAPRAGFTICGIALGSTLAIMYNSHCLVISALRVIRKRLAGMQHLFTQAAIDAALVLLCSQPPLLCRSETFILIL